jgi:Fur family ferric uptake transcriptional regulator
MQLSCIYSSLLGRTTFLRTILLKPSPELPFDELKRRGHRMTKVRAAIIQVLSRRELPLAATDLMTSMKKMGLRPNKTTIYRELTFLIEAGVVAKVDLGERKKRYESVSKGHHHHLVCLKCHTIEELEMQAHLTDQEDEIEKEHDFQVMRHALEFYGLCRRCQS